jgi:DNA-binding LytR/AlgR family response regulator
MMRHRAIVAEDEAPQRQELLRLLTHVWPELIIVAECADGLSAVEALDSFKPEVAFLDIRMPGVSGLGVARHAPLGTQVVFTTAYAEHAVSAFEQGVADFVLKPVTEERLLLAVGRVKQRLSSGSKGEIEHVLTSLRTSIEHLPNRDMRWIRATVGAITKLIPVDDVLFFQASDKYTRVVSRHDEAIVRTPLKELVRRLDAEKFWQIHRSVIVRLDVVKAVTSLPDGGFAAEVAGTDERLPVSPAFRGRFRKS